MNVVLADIRGYGSALSSKSYWRHGVSPTRVGLALLSAFGTLWLATEITSFFSTPGGNWLRAHWLLFLVVGVLSAAWLNRPRHHFACRMQGRDIVIEFKVGDMFELPGAIVIGSNTSFDTNVVSGLISETSVQGQFTLKFYTSVAHLDNDLDAALVGVEPESTAPPQKPGKNRVYKVGTTARVAVNGRTAYFLAIARINEHGVAHGTFEDLKTSLPILWEFIASRGTLEAVVMPVLGSGFSRLPQPREEIVRAIIDSFVAACAASRPTESLTIVVPHKDFYGHEVDLQKLERYVQHVCQYSGQTANPPAAIGVGIN